jgi:plasmid stabilization system protein ParE
MQIRWSPEAASDLESVVGNISNDSQIAAHRIARNIYDHAEALASFPYLGWECGADFRGTCKNTAQDRSLAVAAQ